MDGGCSAGGSLALADLLDEHGDKIYPEVLRYYGVDLRGLFLSELDAKTALCLVYALPPDSMTYAALTNDKDTAGWGITEHLLAGVIDAVQQNTFTNVQVRTKKRLTPPETIVSRARKSSRRAGSNLFAAMARANYQQEG